MVLITLRQLQDEVFAWSEKNAPDSTLETLVKHIEEEVEELELEVALLLHYRSSRVGVEAADLIILLAHLAKLADFDLEAEVAAKWNIVKQRTYVKCEDGVYRHEKSGDASSTPPEDLGRST